MYDLEFYVDCLSLRASGPKKKRLKWIMFYDVVKKLWISRTDAVTYKSIEYIHG